MKRKKKEPVLPAYEEKKRVNLEWNDKVVEKLPIKQDDVVVPVKASQHKIVKSATLQREERKKKSEERQKLKKLKEQSMEIEQSEESEESQESLHNIENEDELELRLLVQRQNEVFSKKENIASIATSILENPDASIQKLKELNAYCQDTDVTIQKMAIISMFKVFKDIIPEYRIITGLDEGVQLSKDVRNLRKFEYELLSNYQKYIQQLQVYIKKAHKASKRVAKARTDEDVDFFQSKTHFESMVGLGKVSIVALGDLLYHKTHFNFRSQIIRTLVPILGSPNDVLYNTALKYIATLFKDEKKGAVSLEITRAITKYIKLKNYRVNQKTLHILIYLNLTVSMEDNEDIFNPVSKKKHMTKKEKKQMKKDKELEKEMAIVSAEENRQEANKIQSELLKTIFLLYFKVLKTPEASNLLPSVLEGMAQFSHLINVDLILNLLEVLKNLIQTTDMPLIASMNCVITSFQTLRNLGDALNVDLKDFYTYLYGLIPKILTQVDQFEKTLPLLVRCLELLLTARTVIGMERVAAFIKRLLISSISLPPNGALALLSIIERLFRKYPKVQQILDAEVCGSGSYQPEIEDPEHTHALSSTAWEFSILVQHYHPTVKKFAELVFKQSTVPDQTPTKLLNSYNFFKFGFVPDMTQPREHVLSKVSAKSQKKGRLMYHFVMPSTLYTPSDFFGEMDHWKNNIPLDDQAFKRHYEDIEDMSLSE